MTRLRDRLVDRSLLAKGLWILAIPLAPLILTLLLIYLHVEQRTPAGPMTRADRTEQTLLLVASAGTVVGIAGSVFAMVLFTSSISSRVRVLHENSSCLVRDEPWPTVPLGGDEVGALEQQLQKAAALLAVRNEAVQRVHQTFNRFFMLSLDLFCVAGFDGYFKRLNPVWPEILGWSEEEFLTQPFLDFVHPDDRDATAREAAKLAGGDVTISFENRYRCKDGTYRWLEWKAVPIVEQSLIHAVARDVTASKIAEGRALSLTAELERRNAQLMTLNRELEAFSYSVSHDLRAPLRSIDGFSQILLEDCADRLDADGRDALNRVRAAATGMGELIDALLALSRLSRVELRAEPVNLSALAESIANETYQSQPNRKAEFVIASGLVVVGDPRLLRAALGNLIGNAWKYTQPRATARIEFGSFEKGDETVYFVRDNGVGFDMTYVNKLFGAFQRLHRQTEFTGTGIGLATVQRIMQRHGGRAWAEGTVDRGATFYFTLPSATKRRLHTAHEVEALAGLSGDEATA